jgi:dihydrofolate reductase
MTRPRISVYIAHSLDGYIADAGGSLDWLFAAAGTEDYGYDEFMAGIDGLAMGRGTWDFIADEPDLPFGGRPVFVFTGRPAKPRDGVQFWSRTPQEAVADWEAAGITHVYLDGGRLISDFLAAGYVDDLILTVMPVLLGDGSPLFHVVGRSTSLELLGSTPYPNGVVQLRYRVRR